MDKHSLQIQGVLYGNEKDALMRTLLSLENAVQVNRRDSGELGEVTVIYGDASAQPLYSEQEIEAIRQRFEKTFLFRYRFFDENTGSAKGQNLLSEESDAEYLMIMNPDVIVSPGYFHTMFEPYLDERCNAGIVEARQTPIEHSKEYDRETLETEWATGACIIVPTALFRQVSGFDSDTFFMYCDDVDLSWRIRLTGKKIYYRPDAVVYHAKTLSATGAWQPTGAEVYYSAEAAILMAYKWSNNERWKELYRIFSTSGDETLRKAARHFKELKDSNRLPEQLDPTHKVARFVGNAYTDHRFTI